MLRVPELVGYSDIHEPVPVLTMTTFSNLYGWLSSDQTCMPDEVVRSYGLRVRYQYSTDRTGVFEGPEESRDHYNAIREQ